MKEVHQPKNKISIDAVKVWRISRSIGQIFVLLAGGGLLYAGIYFGWYRWITTTLIILLLVDFLYALWVILLEPVLLQKYWRYHIDEEFIQLKQGVFNVRHKLIPMTKVQYVEMQQGPLLRRYKLHTISIGTIGSSDEIPALPEEEALLLREQIANFAKINEVE